MNQDLVCLAPSELALWLGLSAEAVEEKVGARLKDGRWRVVPAANADEPDRIELPVADLNVEIDARHEAGAFAHEAGGKAAELEASLAVKNARIDELTALLGQAGRTIEAVRSHSKSQLAELEAARRLNLRLSKESMKAKSTLIAAYDKILDLQQQLVEAREGLAVAREDAAAIDGIAAIIDRMKRGRR